MWAKFGVKADSTTNCYESFHRKVNTELPKKFYFYGDIEQYSNRDLCVKLWIIIRRKLTRKQQNRRRAKPQLEQNRLTKLERIQEYNRPTVCEKMGFKSKY